MKLSLFPRRHEATAAADQALDTALQHLADATRNNEEAVADVRRRKSSGAFRLMLATDKVANSTD